ncbi:KIR protein [Plasmodium coatneyi]|uniref:KIR protein n=1 Tax=Plasmodium coatneyi TaxID=208452 RepID=A0A1B1DSR1_9APIC|nr:KIR protein [Plasmodium coatneyi]ANQ05774.1 KIR protein [Plasmodium coatneyi]
MPEGNNLNYNARCNFLYYWIGDLLFKNVTDPDIVPNTLNSICKYIKSTYLKEKDKVICETIDKNKFNRRKLIFDYWQDYNAIKSLLQSSKSECEPKYRDYLNGIVNAYNTLNTNCTNPANKNNPYCEEFNIPSILGVVGLPTMVFLLYKYTSIFSDLRNTLFGGNNNSRIKRRERSTGRHHFENTLTEGASTFDSSENGSTSEYSTLA